LSQKVCQSLNDITPIITAHGKGEKFVFLTQQDTPTAITQFAYGKLLPGEDVEQHLHPTMEECFYFISGEGKYLIDGIIHDIAPGTFFRIPANTLHALQQNGTQPLTFVYFGIAI
jgi:mannose-6-phosphate isomerase-like protein (cupin superfamily)